MKILSYNLSKSTEAYQTLIGHSVGTAAAAAYAANLKIVQSSSANSESVHEST